MSKKHTNKTSDWLLYREELRELQIELVKLQKTIIKTHAKILVLFEGRDASGKDGTIKRIVEHLSPRETRVVALGKPSDKDLSAWYFQRYTAQLPTAQEMVLFNRSWYNRANVERVMNFCSNEQYHEFIETVPSYEQMLVRSGVRLFKYYLDISKDEQKKRLDARSHDPLKQWKVSPIDKVAQQHWSEYSQARNIMFSRTHFPITPWTIINANDKRSARTNLIKDLLFRLDYQNKDETLVVSNPNIVFNYEESYLHNGMISV